MIATHHTPRVMISSTYRDLEPYRKILIEQLLSFGMFPQAMEFHHAKTDADLIRSSLKMVGESDAYILIIGNKYGQTPKDPKRNKDKISITELEYNEARKRKLPYLLFIMDDSKSKENFRVKNLRKLKAFRQRAMRFDSKGSVHRIYSKFKNSREFLAKLAAPLASLSIELTSAKSKSKTKPTKRSVTSVGIETVRKWGWDSKRFMKFCLARDNEFMGISLEEEGTVEQWADIAWKNPDCWKLLVTDPKQPNSVIGNWHFIPLFNRKEDGISFDAVRKGQIRDTEIFAKNLPVLVSGWYDIYFVAVWVANNEKSRRKRNIPPDLYRCLFQSFLEHFTDLARRGIFINRICANAYSHDGASLCKSLNFKELGRHIANGTVFARTFYPFNEFRFSEAFEELDLLYTQALRKRRRGT